MIFQKRGGNLRVWRSTEETPILGEVWAVVKDAPIYEVSSIGRVRVTIDRHNRNGRHFWKGKIITQNCSEEAGYLKANLWTEDGQVCALVHRLVAGAFVAGRTEERDFVNHKNGDKQDNLQDNLEWTTPKENVTHARATGLHSGGMKGETNHNAKLDALGVEHILYLRHDVGLKHNEIAAMHPGLHPKYIALVVTGKRWNHVYKEFMKGRNQ